MYSFERSGKLLKVLKKLYRKDRGRYEATLNEMEEVMSGQNPHHYKNLSHDMKQFKRAHIDKHFVLIFKVDENKRVIKFIDLQHHDHIYR